MPIYDYRCKKCGEKFEAYRPFSATDKDVRCPGCGASHPERKFSIFASKISKPDCSPAGTSRFR